MKQAPLKPISLLQLDQLADQKYRTWYVLIDPTYTQVEDVFRPEFWASSHERLAVPDLIRVRAKDESYDFTLKVVAKHRDERLQRWMVHVDMYPKIPDEVLEGMLRARTIKRIVTVNGKLCPRVERNETHGWRLMGFGNEFVSLHDSQELANEALAALKLAGGLAPEDDVEAAPAPAAPAGVPYGVAQKDKKKAERDARRAAEVEQLKARGEANKAAGLA